jgi:Terminase large subunit, T4likevirus-type, N-terminal
MTRSMLASRVNKLEAACAHSRFQGQSGRRGSAREILHPGLSRETAERIAAAYVSRHGGKAGPTDALRLAARDLACYAIAQWPAFQLATHHRLMAERLEAIERGEIRRLLILAPPRHGKSLLTTQFFPAWYMGRHPEHFVISTSYGQELAEDFGRRVREFVSDPLHRAIFPNYRLAEDANSIRRFSTTRGGSYYAVGRGDPLLAVVPTC